MSFLYEHPQWNTSSKGGKVVTLDGIKDRKILIDGVGHKNLKNSKHNDNSASALQSFVHFFASTAWLGCENT